MEKFTDKINGANLILVPKGDDNQPCIRAFEKATGTAIPEFDGRKLEAKNDGLTYIKVKGSDVPRLIAAGYGDIGLTGFDSCEDFLETGGGIDYQTFGERMCRFVLLAPYDKALMVREQIESKEINLKVATSFPRLLGKYALAAGLILTPADISVAGSVEIMPRLMDVPLVADLVSSGGTAKANGLVEIKSLSDVYPALVTRNSKPVEQLIPISYSDINRIDETLKQRSEQISNSEVNSYTLELMRNRNKAGKKAGEEFSETVMAIFGDETPRNCESEIADLIYAQMILAYSRDKPVKLSNIIRILIDSNRLSGEVKK